MQANIPEPSSFDPNPRAGKPAPHGVAGLRGGGLLLLAMTFLLIMAANSGRAQTLINVHFGVGSASAKHGLAATGMGTNDFWNLYRHYDPKFTPGMALVAEGRLDNLKLADGAGTTASIAVTNAPGVWGNSSGDPMYDSYLFAQNGSNIVITVSGLAAGRYHFYLYGHADADVSGEQNSSFTVKSGTNSFGPLAATGGSGWKAGDPWREKGQYVVFRDVPVEAGPVVIEVAAGPNGVSVVNGLQIVSRGTGSPRLPVTAPLVLGPVSTNLLFREIRYDGRVTDTEARFRVSFEVESLTTNELSAVLFEGNVALSFNHLPEGVRIIGRGALTRLFCAAPGVHHVDLDLVAKITRNEPWNQVSFSGPAAAIALVTARSAAAGVELQLLSGASLEGDTKAASLVRGVLGLDRVLALRWQSKTAEVARKSLITAETTSSAQIAPAAIKYTTTLRYQILQAPAPRLKVELPAGQALTRLQAEQVRDWRVEAEGDRQVLTVEFIKPVEKGATLTLFTEQSAPAGSNSVTLVAPVPLEVEHESGVLTLSAEDTTVEIQSTPGLRQVNPPAGALASYRFTSRPASVTAGLERILPIIKVADRVGARIEESRMLVSHLLNLTVEKAGVYTLELIPQAGFVVSEVKGEGIEDWKFAEGKLSLAFTNKLLGARQVQVEFERAQPEFPQSVTVMALAVTGATNITTQLGAGASPGIRLKTTEMSGLREVPVGTFAPRSDEVLAFGGEVPGWRLTLAVERLAARVLAEVFNLVTVGDGVVGGSATIRYGILYQGVQQFRVALPPHWRNIEFTGASIRRKEQATNVWTITLQDKAWGAYTLVVTYDYQFDPKGATLDLAGAHAVGVERESGSLGVMTAANLKLTPAAPAEPLQRVDEAELAASDRALCTRPLVLAYRYTGGDYHHSVPVTRFAEVSVLDAVADRTELTTVLTEAGQLLTQSSFMVKNTEKQFQRFRLPKDAEFWSSFVNGQPAKPEKDGDWLLVPLPRDVSRDQAFAVDIVYAQTNDLRSSLFPRRFQLGAPLTDIPNTYAEWQLFAPVAEKLSAFGGNMTVASGTTYEFRDAWSACLQFYGRLIEDNVAVLAFSLCLGVLLAILLAGVWKGARGALVALLVFFLLAVLAAMLLPALATAKARSQRISAMNNLKQIGLAAKTWAIDNGDLLPPSFEAMKSELGTEKVTIDPDTGQPFVYVGAGKTQADPSAIIAYSTSDAHGRNVLLADGSVQVMSADQFNVAMQRDNSVQPQAGVANAPAVPQAATAVAMPQRPGQNLVQPPAGPVSQQALANAPQVVQGQPGQMAGLGGGMGGGGFRPPATVSGVHPIRIEIPRSGQAFTFTKVLNTKDEPLTISAAAIRLKVFHTEQMVLQTTGFLVGVGWLWWLARRPVRSSLWLAAAALLILWSIEQLLLMWRVLHLGMIATVPLLGLFLVAWALRVAWRHRKASRRPAPPASPIPPVVLPPSPPLSPGAAAPAGSAAIVVLLLVLASGFSVRAEEASVAGGSNSVAVLSARYAGTVSDRAAEIDADVQIATVATNQFVALFGSEVALQSFTNADGARLELAGGTLGVRIPRVGTFGFQFKLLARLGGDITRRRLAFGIPPALASRVNLVIQEPDADVDFPGALSLQRTGTNQQTRVEAVLGAVDRLELNWTPKVKRAAEIAATVFVQNTAVVSLGGGVINTRATLDYQISQGEIKQARLQIPSGQRLLRVEGDSLRTWEVTNDVLVVDLIKGVSPGYRLVLETEMTLNKLPGVAKVQIPHALDVKRETGLLAVRGTEEIALSIEGSSELQRVDPEEFHKAAPGVAEGFANAFRFVKPEFVLTVRADPIEARLEAVERNTVRISPDTCRFNARVDYAIKGAGVFTLRLLLPADYRLEEVSGTNVSQWAERQEAGARLLEVTLKERTVGAFSLNLALSRSYSDPPKLFIIPFVHPLETRKLSGFMVVSADQGVAAKTDSLEGLSEIPLGSVPEATGLTAGSLAYKFISSAPGPQPTWRLSVALEAVEAWVRAELMNTITVSETLVSGRTLVKYAIANAPTREFRLKVPAAFKNVDVSGVDIRRRDETNGEWRVELQSKVQGELTLVVTWELPREPGAKTLDLDAIQALGVERESGFVAVVARAPLQVGDRSAADFLNRIDVREMPDWAGRPDTATALVFRYLRPGYRIALEVQRFEQAGVLDALIDSARLTTVVAEDGQMMTELTLSVRNNGRQHLEVDLPSGARVWSAFVAGEPVRPSTNNARLLIPLARDIASDAPTTVEMTYIGAGVFPSVGGGFGVASPGFDMPLKNAHWDLFLPADYEYRKFEGSMTRSGEATTPVIQAFSISQYNSKQVAQEAQQKSELQASLQSAREGLVGNNLRQAVSSLNRSKAYNQMFQAEPAQDQDVKAVEQALRRAQGSNLINAQNDYFYNNGGANPAASRIAQRYGLRGGTQQQMPRFEANSAIVMNYDAEIAGQQWEKLEKAQRVATSKLAPLRVNLPTHGVRYSFTQVLQTELRKPMTITLVAENTKLPSWLHRFEIGLAGFVALWAGFALVSRRKAV